MASPFASRANARIAWRQPATAPTSLRDGLAPAAVSTTVIEAFLTGTGQVDRPGASTNQSDGRATAVMFGAQVALGYITRWAVVPDGDDWLDAGTGWSWNTTGLRPPLLTASEQEAELYFGPLEALPTAGPGTLGTFAFLQVGWNQGDGGIGAVLRAKAGDRFSGVIRRPR